MASYSADEMMVVSASRALPDGAVCFVGIGQPSAAANLARLTHAPNVVLIYESGTIESRPDVLPLSIGDGELAETASTVVSVPEMFRYWLQAGRIDFGFLGAAQIDRYGNLNSTLIGGSYAHPKTRLPGAGGAPEIATSSKQVLVIMRHSVRSFVDKLDFISSVGHYHGRASKVPLGIPGNGPTRVITDLAILEPDADSLELTVTHVHPGVTVEQVKAATGWALKISDDVRSTPAPTARELEVLRDLYARTDAAHRVAT